MHSQVPPYKASFERFTCGFWSIHKIIITSRPSSFLIRILQSKHYFDYTQRRQSPDSNQKNGEFDIYYWQYSPCVSWAWCQSRWGIAGRSSRHPAGPPVGPPPPPGSALRTYAECWTGRAGAQTGPRFEGCQSAAVLVDPGCRWAGPGSQVGCSA